MLKAMLRTTLSSFATLIGVSFVAFLIAGAGRPDETSEPGSEVPLFVQYGRWLSHACPIKVGPRAQVLPSGELIREPIDLPDPSAWMWFRAGPLVPSPGTSPVAATDPVETKQAAYGAAQRQYAAARTEYLRQRDSLDALLLAYVKETRIKNAVTPAGRPSTDILAVLRPNTSLASYQGLIAQADTSFLRMEEAQKIGSDIVAILATKPYPEAGLSIIPRKLSIAAPDLGFSGARQRPVLAIVIQAFGITALLLGAAMVCHRALRPSTEIWGRALARLSIPTVLAATLAAGILLGAGYLGALPGRGLHSPGAEAMSLFPSHAGDEGLSPGYLLDVLWHLVLPVGCLVCAVVAVLNAKPGAPRSFCSIVPAMLCITAAIEQALDIPGLGHLLIHSIQNHDRDSFIAASVVMWAAGSAPVLWTRASGGSTAQQ